MREFRRAIRSQILELVGQSSDGGARKSAARDEGLFGPHSTAWKVHGDVTSMMIGGVGALLLQMLHPAALAGVWDHSDFRSGMSGRLKRTARFISGTTYGSTDVALASIDRVRAIHDRVRGKLPDGTDYSANDPDLLTWVHVAEVSSFIKSYMRYRDPLMSVSRQDRYFAEMSVVARRLGAADIPVTRRQASAYLLAMRPQLRANARTREVSRILLAQTAPNFALAPLYGIMFRAGADLLPDWAARMHGLHEPLHRRPAIRASALGIGAGMRWAMNVGA